MQTITTKFKSSTTTGRGNVIAVANIDGKRRQATVPWNHAKSSDWNHGAAAGTLAQRVGLPFSENITQTIDNDGRHTFGFPV